MFIFHILKKCVVFVLLYSVISMSPSHTLFLCGKTWSKGCLSAAGLDLVLYPSEMSLWGVMLFWGPEVVCLWHSTALCRHAGFLTYLSWGRPAHLCITWYRHAYVCQTPSIINDKVGNKGMHLRSFLRAVQGLSMLTAPSFYSSLLSRYTNLL